MNLPRFIQIHTLHTYPAALLNRDDAGLAKRLGVGPVPHVVFADGSKNVGYMPSADLGKKLGTVKATF